MSRYGFLVCDDCKDMLWLGKAVYGEDNRIDHFNINSPEAKDSDNSVLNRAVWKMLAEHAGHTLRVAIDDSHFKK